MSQTGAKCRIVRQQKEEHWHAYVAEHRKATVEHSNSMTTGKTLVEGHRACDIAAKHSEVLVQTGSSHRITARALQEWYQQGRVPGAAPKKPGRKANPNVQTLVDAVKSHAKMQQIDGHSMKPKELSGLMKSATLGTPLESKTETDKQLEKLLLRTRQGNNRLGSSVGESIAQNRSVWLTEGNVAHSLVGWEMFLVGMSLDGWESCVRN